MHNIYCVAFGICQGFVQLLVSNAFQYPNVWLLVSEFSYLIGVNGIWLLVSRINVVFGNYCVAFCLLIHVAFSIPTCSFQYSSFPIYVTMCCKWYIKLLVYRNVVFGIRQNFKCSFLVSVRSLCSFWYPCFWYPNEQLLVS